MAPREGNSENTCGGGRPVTWALPGIYLRLFEDVDVGDTDGGEGIEETVGSITPFFTLLWQLLLLLLPLDVALADVALGTSTLVLNTGAG